MVRYILNYILANLALREGMSYRTLHWFTNSWERAENDIHTDWGW